MESVLLLLASQLESGDAAHQGAQIEPVRFGGLPGDKRHPPDKLQHHIGIELIGLGALQQGFGEVGNGARIGDHDLDPFSPIQSQRQIEAIKTGCFKANLDGRRRLAQPLNQDLVPGCGVGKLPPLAARLGGGGGGAPPPRGGGGKKKKKKTPPKFLNKRRGL